MSKKLTAKDLLTEVQSIKKQASASICKPEPIEYENEEELEAIIPDEVSQGPLEGWGSIVGIQGMVVRDGVAFVRATVELELDVIRTYKVVSQETVAYLDATTAKISRNFDSSWYNWRGEYLSNQEAALSNNRNERAYIALTQDYVEFTPSGAAEDIQAPDSIYEALGDQIMLSDKMYANWPNVRKKLPRGVQKEDLPGIILAGLKEYTSKARRYSQNLDDPRYWVQW